MQVCLERAQFGYHPTLCSGDHAIWGWLALNSDTKAMEFELDIETFKIQYTPSVHENVHTMPLQIEQNETVLRTLSWVISY